MTKSVIRFSALVALLTLLSGCAHTLKKGQNALDSGEPEEAEKHAQEGLAEDPSDPYLNTLMADALVAQNKYDEAYPFAAKVYDALDIPDQNQTPADLEGPVSRTYGKIAWEKGRTLDAVKAWGRARSVDPNFVPKDQYLRALETAIAYAESTFDFESSIKIRTELQSLSNDHPLASDAQIRGAHESLAAAQEQDGRLEDAITTFENLESQLPSVVHYPFSLGRLHAMLGNNDEAIAAFDRSTDRAVALGTSKAQHLDQIVARITPMDRPKIAHRFLNELLRELGKPSLKRARIHRLLAELAFGGGDSKQGLNHLMAFVSDATAGGTRPSTAFLQASDIATRFGDRDVALEVLRKGVAQTGSWRVTRRLAESYQRRGQSKKIEELLNGYLARSNTNNAAHVVGRWALARRQPELARHYLEKYTESVRSDPTVWYDLAETYSQLERPSELRVAVRNYIKLSEGPRAHQLAANIFMRNEMWDDAEKELFSALKADPDNTDIINSLTSLYNRWGRPERIAKLYTDWAKRRGNDPDHLYFIADRFARQPNPPLAIKFFRRAALAGRNDAWLRLSDVYRNQRKIKLSDDAISNYLAGAKNRHQALATVFNQYRGRPNSDKIVEELMELEPSNVEYCRYLAQSHSRDEHPEAAQKVWNGCVAAASNPVHVLEEMIHGSPDQFRFAIPIMHEMIDGDGNFDPALYKLMGDAYDVLDAERLPHITGTNEIFAGNERSRRYYELYLQHGKPTPAQLRSFASDMQRRRYWNLAAHAYEKLDVKSANSAAHLTASYADTLLYLGRSDEALQLLERHYQTREQSIDAARTIAEKLLRFDHLTAATPYLERQMEASNESIRRTAFISLIRVYSHTGQQDKISPLIEKYLSKSQNPTEARRTLLQSLTQHGLWEIATVQLERLVENQDEQLGLSLATQLYRQGRTDEAKETALNYANDHVNPETAWHQVALFFSERGMTEEAEDAFLNATNSEGHDRSRIQVDHAIFRISNGDVEGGRALFEQVRKDAPGLTEFAFDEELNTLGRNGYFKELREAARATLKSTATDRSRLNAYRALKNEFVDNTEEAKRLVDGIKTDGFSAADMASLYWEYGARERIVELIEEESQSGNAAAALDLLSRYRQSVVREFGVQKLMRLAKPLLDNEPASYHAHELGLYLAQIGERERAIPLLRRAILAGNQTAIQSIQMVYLHSGEFEKAASFLQQYLRRTHDPIEQQTAVFNQFVAAAQLAGFKRELESLAKQMAQTTRFEHLVLPYYVRSELLQGRTADVINLIRSLWNRPISHTSPRNDPNNNAPDVIHTIAAALAEMAAAGHTEEALSLIDDAPDRVKFAGAVKDVALRIQAFSSDNPSKALLEAAKTFGTTQTDNLRRLRVAWLAIASGHPEVAKTISEPLLNSSNIFTSSGALNVLLSIEKTASPDATANPKTTVDAFVERHDNKHIALIKAGDILTALAFDDLAKDVRARAAQAVPTVENRRSALQSAIFAGDVSAQEHFAALMRFPEERFHANAVARGMGARGNAELMDLTFEQMDRTSNASFNTMMLRARWNYERGAVDDARDTIRGYIAERQDEPEVRARVAVALYNDGLYGELVGWLFPKDDIESLGPRTLLAGGLANVKVGRTDAGIRLLDLALSKASGPQSTILVMHLLEEGEYALAERYAAQGVVGVNSGWNFAVLASVAIAVGDVPAAKAALDRALASDSPDAEIIAQVMLYALRSNQLEFARPYLEKLFTFPGYGGRSGVRLLLTVFEKAGRASDGVAFVEERAHLISDIEFGQPLSSLYENAGNPERAYSFYQGRIDETWFSRWDLNSLPLNNLAYQYSTTNKNIDQGIKNVNLAIVLGRDGSGVPQRMPSYIDTLGWLKYRLGDLEGAERDIRAAIQSTTDGSVSTQQELMGHLSEILKARGKFSEAATIDTHLGTLGTGDVPAL